MAENMFYNNANCDIYIGKGAGKKLMDDMKNAKSSVKIVSPYLSPYLISELIYLKNRDIDVKLITTNDIEDFYGNKEKNIYKLIIQNRNTNDEKQVIRNRWISLVKILLYINYSLITLFFLLLYYFKDIRTSICLIPIIIIFLIYSLYRSKIRNLRIYTYNYTQLFPFKVYTSFQNEKTIHGKIYLIDDEIAYLGSLNFTKNGTEYNYETRIRTIDSNAVIAIKNEIDNLFHNPHMPSIDVQDWGRQLYNEPIN